MVPVDMIFEIAFPAKNCVGVLAAFHSLLIYLIFTSCSGHMTNSNRICARSRHREHRVDRQNPFRAITERGISRRRDRPTAGDIAGRSFGATEARQVGVMLGF